MSYSNEFVRKPSLRKKAILDVHIFKMFKFQAMGLR